jgi:carbon storage regulator
MLVLGRLLDESITIGEDVVVKVVKVRGDAVWLGVEAPREVRVMRTELLERKKKGGGR